MKNLIEHVAHLNQRGKENLATELLAELIRSPIARNRFGDYLRRFGTVVRLPYEVTTQKRGVESRCIPDIWIFDSRNNPVALIESKFHARFTYHQPNSYIDEIGAGGLLLFIVPDRRRSRAAAELRALCTAQPAQDDGRPWQFKINERYFAVSTWNEILDALEPDDGTQPDRYARYSAYLNELRGFCDVASKEVFPPLTAEQIGGRNIAGVLCQLKWLTENIIRRCTDEGILQTLPKKRTKENELGADTDSSLYFGQNMLMGNLTIWLGFYGSAWEEYATSPLWIEMAIKGDESRQFVKQLRLNKGEEFVKEKSDGKDLFLIAIPIEPELSQSEVVESAVQFLAELKDLMLAARTGPAVSP